MTATPSSEEIRWDTSSVGRGTSAEPDEAEPRIIAESAPDFFRRLADQTPPPMLIDGFLPGVGTTLLHGQPRTLKTIIAQAAALSLTTGTSLFGRPEYQVGAARAVWLVTDEDPESEVHTRLRALMAGAGIAAPPPGLHISAGRGVDFDDPDAQVRIEEYLAAHSIRLLIVDPIRAATACADQGPRELRPFVLFLRHLMRQTGVAVLLVHHDTKPAPGVRDDRTRPLRASGGGLYSVADSPIHVERIEDGRSLIVPTGWKFGAAPSSLQVRLETDALRQPTVLRLVAETTTAVDADTLALQTRVLEHLQTNGPTCASHLATRLRVRREAAIAGLEDLYRAGVLDVMQTGRRKDYFIRSQEREQ